jgi:hypothetical protein
MITAEEALLRKKTATKPKVKEPREDFLIRLLEEVEKLSDDDWEKLGQEPGGTAAQKWCNDAVDARKAENSLPDFVAPDENGEVEEQEGDDEEEEKAVVKKAKKVNARSAKAPPEDEDGAPAKVKAAKVKAAANGPLDGIKVRIKDLVIDEPHITLEDLLAKLSKGGDKMSRMTVSSVRSETRHTLRVLKQRGKLRGVEI